MPSHPAPEIHPRPPRLHQVPARPPTPPSEACRAFHHSLSSASGAVVPLKSGTETAAGASKDVLHVGATGVHAFLHATPNATRAPAGGCGPRMARFHPKPSRVLLAKGGFVTKLSRPMKLAVGPARTAPTGSFTQARALSTGGVQAPVAAARVPGHPCSRGALALTCQ